MTNTLSEMQMACMRYGDEARAAVGAIAFRAGGILPSEAVVLWCLCRHLGVGGIVESGRHLGYSTEVLLAFASLYCLPMVSIDRCPLAARDAELTEKFNLPSHGRRLVTGEASHLLTKVVASMHRPLVFLDGPKGAAAVDMLHVVRKTIAVGAVHDMSCRSYGQNGSQPNMGRAAAAEWPDVAFTDEHWVTSAYGDLDRAAWHPDYSSREELVAYGFTIAVLPGLRWSDD